jgi:hypothetical protein
VHFAYALSKRHRPQQPLWRYPVHLATQIPVLRTARHKVVSVRRRRNARLRERLADIHQSPFRNSQRAGTGVTRAHA